MSEGMDAQKAIEILEKEVVNLKDIFASVDAGEVQAESSGMKQMRERALALSIVLETAKTFHSGEPIEGPHYYYFDGWHIRKDQLNKIGILTEGQLGIFK